jgi:hypothetical protein
MTNPPPPDDALFPSPPPSNARPDPEPDPGPVFTSDELFGVPSVVVATAETDANPVNGRGGTGRSDVAIIIIVALAALAAAAASTAPTGVGGVDLVLRVAYAVVIVMAAARARRWSLVVLAGTAAAASRNLAAIVSAWVSLVAVLASVGLDLRRRWLNALVAALATVALYRLGDVGFQGASGIIAMAAPLAVLVSSYNRQRRVHRRRIRQGVVIVAGLLGVVTAGALLATLFGSNNMKAGLTSARAGVASAKAGDNQAASASLQDAVDSFDSARSQFDAWYAVPARYTPLLSYQVVAMAELAAAGHDLTTTASDVAETANYHSISVVDGRIDIDQIRSLEAPLVNIEAGLVQANTNVGAVSTEWLAPPLKVRFDEVAAELSDASREAAVAIDAVRVAPAMLGGDGPRRYFVAFTTPAESRGLGGFMGSWAELTADDGRLELTRTGASDVLAPKPGDPERTLTGPDDYVRRYGPNEPQNQVRDVTLSPDFPSVSEVMGGIYPQTNGGAPIDGMVAMDPYALAAMLRITGPINCVSCGKTLNGDNAAEYLLREQYLTFDDRAERVDALDEAARVTFDKFISAPSLRPAQLASLLGPMVSQRRLMASSTTADEQAFLAEIGMSGAFADRGTDDLFSLVTQNGGNNKMDVFLHRTVDYDTTFNPDTGEVAATATVTLRNDAPTTGLPNYVLKNRDDVNQPNGTNWTWLNFYSPHRLTQATIDGQPLSLREQDEFGLKVYNGYVAVASGATVTIELTLEGTLPVSVADDGVAYRLVAHQQPLVNPDEVTITVRPTSGWRPADGLPAERPRYDGAPTGDTTLAVPLTPTG